MPELAEVAIIADILDGNIGGKKMTSFDIVAGRYLKKDPVGYWDFVDELPMTVNKVDSKGKFMWFELEGKKPDNKWYILQNFGLAGRWALEEPPRPNFIVSFGKTKIYYIDDRHFGTVVFTPNKADLDAKLNKLGPDFLKTPNVNLKDIQTIDKPIVDILKDQGKIGSGIGNYLSAEILYRAKIDPFRHGINITNKELDNLNYWIKYLTKLAYSHNSTRYMNKIGSDIKTIRKKNYHKDITLKEPTFVFKVYRQKTDPKGNPVESLKNKGQTTYWVPAVQK